MRSSILGLGLVFVACAAGPVPFSGGEVVGQYRFTVGPDQREEFFLQAEGRLVWERYSNAMLRERGVGQWSVSGDEVRVCLPGFSFALRGTAGALVVRRFGGHVYLVRDADLAWFGSNGPMEEFCLSRDGAPLVESPMFKVNQQAAGSASTAASLADHRPSRGSESP
jgi:hypothetical protein